MTPTLPIFDLLRVIFTAVLFMTENITHPQQRAFLAAYAEIGNVTRTAAIAGISREAHYDWKAEDEDYARAFERARLRAVDTFEDEARRRAVDGYDQPQFYPGEPCGQVRKYSDTLLALLLKGAKPRVYRENVSAEISGPEGKPLAVEVDLSGLTEDELTHLRQLAQKAAQSGADRS